MVPIAGFCILLSLEAVSKGQVDAEGEVVSQRTRKWNGALAGKDEGNRRDWEFTS